MDPNVSIPGSPGETNEMLDTSLESQLAQALSTLGIGELNIDIRRQVLNQVGNDVAQAVDWIMENSDRLSSWMSDMSSNALDHNLVQGAAVITKDGHSGRISQINGIQFVPYFSRYRSNKHVLIFLRSGDGTFHLEFDDHSPRLHLSRDDFLVDEHRDEVQLIEHMQSMSDNVEALNFQ